MLLSYNFVSFIIICMNVFTLSNNEFHTSFNQRKIVVKSKINQDISRIKQKLEPIRCLFNSRATYYKHHTMLKTLWTCCPQQRISMFDIRNSHQARLTRTDCINSIRNNRIYLTKQCHNDLKSFDPIHEGIDFCDGQLLRNLADKHIFVVELLNYTKKWCIDGFYPMLIYSDINQILPCERAIRQGLRKDRQSYDTYDTLSNNILDVYVKNIQNYRQCSAVKHETI
mgnify:CR=1 FL=1